MCFRPVGISVRRNSFLFNVLSLLYTVNVYMTFIGFRDKESNIGHQ